MDMDQKHAQAVMEWLGQGGWAPPGTTLERPAAPDARKRPRRQDAGREAIFDIADFEAIAAFAGLRPPLGQAG